MLIYQRVAVGVYDSLWFTMIHYDSLWFTMIHYDSLWFTMGLGFHITVYLFMIHYDSLWFTMIHYDSLWFTMIHYDSLWGWGSISQFTCLWFTMIHYDSLWFTMIHYDSLWFTMFRIQTAIFSHYVTMIHRCLCKKRICVIWRAIFTITSCIIDHKTHLIGGFIPMVSCSNLQNIDTVVICIMTLTDCG